MFRKILIANRGEIAVRVIRACRDMGIISVAIYSDADRESLHTLIADEAVCIGPAASRDSYLNMAAILTAAKAVGADAIHPGYGFLSENARFAQLCEENGITFIGPSSRSIALVGDKAAARRTVSAAGVPIVPGSEGIITSIEEAERIADEIGYPVMIKAANGGGGKGIRLVESKADLARAFDTARSEAKANFGDDGVYIEKFIRDPHHIEFQILADKAGNTIHLMERDCSMQRRHQKVLEETPSAFLTPELREKMGAASVAAAKAAGYYGAGTVEYLVDADRNFYFMEMNARIQVEHPVTEELTGVDLVRAQ
ncbi:MAG: ATP-grasp domain-containing protein, partial [Clostridia bacterium]|nr:ATP-grasp domain-containing protein [Clostridia bacterium]